MESNYSTPVSVTSKTPRTGRRRALSPSKCQSNYSSPYQNIDFGAQTPENVKSRLLESEKLVEDLRSERDRLQEKLLNQSGLNESVIIETSNRISTQETRIFKRDLNVLEGELLNNKTNVRKLNDRISELEKEKEKYLDEINDLQSKLEDCENDKKLLRERLHVLENKVIAKEDAMAKLNAELTDAQQELGSNQAKFHETLAKLNQQVTALTSKWKSEKEERDACNAKLQDAQETIQKLQTELKTQKSLYDEMGLIDKVHIEDEQTETTKKVLNEVQQLSTRIQDLTPLRRPINDEKEQFLRMSARVIEENITDLKRRNTRLTKEIEEKTNLLTSTQEELERLKREMDEAAGNSEQSHKFLREENAKLTLQKAEIRCELLHARRELEGVDGRIQSIEKERDDAISKRDQLRQEKEHVEQELVRLRAMHDVLKTELTDKLEEAEAKVSQLEGFKIENETLRTEISKKNNRLCLMGKHLEMADEQCSKLNRLKEGAEGSRRRAIEQCNDMVAKIRSLEVKVETQRKVEQEIEMLRAENERQKKKIEYLNEEIREIHADYRQELSRIEAEKENEQDNHPMLDALKLKLSQKESELRTSKKRVDELNADNQKLSEQLADLRKQQSQIIDENVKLRGGLSEALNKIENYKRDSESAREMTQRLAEELGDKDQKLAKLEEELNEKLQQVSESEQVVNYLHSQINVKSTKMPKLSRRSTLLSTISESNLDTSTILREADEIRKLESEKMELLSRLEDMKRLKEKRTAESTIIVNTTTTSTISVPPTKVKSKSASDVPMRPGMGIMRHDIPHKWNVSNWRIYSAKCEICFDGIPTIGKAKKCAHCGVQVHANCASRVFNTCGMPAECANVYRENCTTVPVDAVSEGRMNGWLRIYRDDMPGTSWISSWAIMDPSRISFYTNDGADLDKPFFTIDLNREQWVLRAGMEMPVECDDEMRTSSVLMLKMPGRALYLLAPSPKSARRWADCLQYAQRKRMMLSSKPSAFAEYSCLLVLNSPNNLKIFKAVIIEDWILFATQIGLCFTSVSQPRNPIRISGPQSVTSMELMTETNCLCMVANSSGQLAMAPLDSLLLAMCSVQPSIPEDKLPEFNHVTAIKYLVAGNQKFLVVAEPTILSVLKYNSTRDIYVHFAKIALKEPVTCIEATSNGFFYASDTFYFVSVDSQMNTEAKQVVAPRKNDYPMNISIINESELLLSYQNCGIMVDRSGNLTRTAQVEWEQMPMEFMYISPFLYVIHYDSIEILEVGEYNGPNSKIFLPDREVFECVNAHIIGRQFNDAIISVSSKESTEIHRFSTSASGRRAGGCKRRGMSPGQTLKRTKN
ncbi:unnamed protein product [Caenorhabditis bovis]|uniref:Phorbol-ester/DAG-type domain-containing protein n=1 Tax=Caenorhabditis bovis TaxID=2654633 RepID=A0A8S1EPQ5_9PELO|nr:unnamed protein product [Caenorhabditis bovis]